MRFLEKAWDTVKPETIARCFRKANFIWDPLPVQDLEQTAEDDLTVQFFLLLFSFF